VGIDERLALSMAREKLIHAKEAQADAIVLMCPFCGIMYDANQRKIEGSFEEELGMPVLYYPQLLGLGLGLSPDELGFKMNSIKTENLKKKIDSLPLIQREEPVKKG
jgi:heterodisulfide reductase subunit B